MKMLSLIFIFVAGSANATILNLPPELKGANEEEIEMRALEAISEHFNCELELSDNLRSIALGFKLEDGELQDAEYAEYEGELSAFTLVAKVNLPGKTCYAGGVYECKAKFVLYDEKAYQLEPDSLVCSISGLRRTEIH